MTLYADNHQNESLPFCECGCGNRVKKKGRRFLHNHHVKVLKVYEAMAEYASSLKGRTWEEIYGEEKAAKMKKDKSVALKDRSYSEETIALWSSQRKGKGNPFYNKHHSNTTKKKLRNHFKGKHLSKEHRRKVSIGLSKAFEEGRMNRKSKTYKEGKFFSFKNDKFIKYRSSYELFVYEFLEKMKKVKSYEVEPFHIEYLDENLDIRRYIPDILIKYVDGSMELVEIKPRNFISLPSNKCKFLAAEKFCKINGLSFSILTSKKGSTDISKVGISKLPIYKKEVDA